MSTNTADYQRDYMRQYRAAGRDNGRVRNRYLERDFVGCDGEGGDLDNGYHAYFMLRIGENVITPVGRNVRLTTQECLDFICDQDPKVIHVGYFFDYDVAKILEDLPWEKLDRLVHREKRTGLNGMVFPVDYMDFQVDYLPRKEFKVRRVVRRTEDETVWSPWIVISDVGTFFQMSFLKAIQVWGVGTPEEHEQIRVGKLARASFSSADLENIGEYNALEIRLLQELMAKFRAACESAGYIPKKWQGPGVLAETMLAANGVKKSKDVPLLQNPDFADLILFARNAFYGGRFEVAGIGPIPGPAYQLDINSAYPYAMQFVPCLEHGKWERASNKDATRWEMRTRRPFDTPQGKVGERFALMYGSFARSGPPTLWYGLPVRTKTGTIVFPESGRGWYWSFEIDSAAHQQFSPEEVWVYTRTCRCQPLGFVKGTYAHRKKLGKDGPGLVLKLGLNSLYGKTVQSIGFPKYANPIWGSFITAYPRMMINNLIHSSPVCVRARERGTAGCGRDVIMVATDSVATTLDRSLDVEISEALGAWSNEVHPEGMFTVQPGVYFGTSEKPTKTRGFTRTVVDEYQPAFRAAFTRMVESGRLDDGAVSLPITIFCGIRYALQRRDMSLLGQWIEYGTAEVAGKVLSFDWTTKRQAMTLTPTKSRPWIQTLPFSGSADAETIPYSKNIGGLMEAGVDRLAFADLPDWSPLGAMYD